MIFAQFLISIFVVFAISRVLARFKEGKLSTVATLAWFFLWLAVEIAVWIPNSTTLVAQILGIGRGADLIIYGSIVALFYLIFRIYIKLQDIEREITQVVRKVALQNISKISPKKRKK